MNFTDNVFYIFLPTVLLMSWLLREKSLNLYKLHMIFFSSVFYGWWDYRFLGLLYYSTAVDYVAGLKIQRTEIPRIKKIWLLFSLVNNLGLLFYFKYVNFFIDNLRNFGIDAPAVNVILPVGISFYTFQTMSYSIDIYRKELKAETNFLNFLYYTIFFPQLVAGPIVRAIEFLPQIKVMPEIKWVRIKEGICIFCTGLIKKLLIANSVAPFVDHIFSSPQIYSTTTIWCAVIAYSIQIFCDFSGYTDMAIGVSRMLGHSLVDNFNMPYISRSITEFWRRWHISLSRWIRDYIYISLGGNRKGKIRTYVHLILTMMLGGLWHGASWNFVIWGTLHGFALALEKMFHLDKKFFGGFIGYLRWLISMLFVLICWVFFRAKDLSAAVEILNRMFKYQDGITWVQTQFVISLIVVIISHLARHFIIRSRYKYFIPNLDTFWGIFILFFVIFGIIVLNPKYYNPFIYFQF